MKTKDRVRIEVRYYTNGLKHIKNVQWRAKNQGMERVRVVVEDTEYWMPDGSKQERLVSLYELISAGETRKAISDHIEGAFTSITNIRAKIRVELE